MGFRSDLNTFAGLEIGEELIRRSDTSKYQTALRRARNIIGMIGGGVRKRTGFLFGAVSADSSKRSRVIPFQFSATQGYAIEITDQKARVFFEGFPLVETELIITGIANSNPAEVEAPAHGYATGDQVYISGQLGMTQVNGRTFKITVLDADTFTLDGVSALAYGAWTGSTGGVAGDAEGDVGGTPPGGEEIPTTPPVFEDFTPTERAVILDASFTAIYGFAPSPFAIDFMGTYGYVPSFDELYPDLVRNGYYGGG